MVNVTEPLTLSSLERLSGYLVWVLNSVFQGFRWSRPGQLCYHQFLLQPSPDLQDLSSKDRNVLRAARHRAWKTPESPKAAQGLSSAQTPSPDSVQEFPPSLLPFSFSIPSPCALRALPARSLRSLRAPVSAASPSPA